MDTGQTSQRRLLLPEQAALPSTTGSQRGGHAPRAEPGLDARELKRRVWHSSPGLLAIILWFVPHRDPLSPTLQAIFLFAIAGIAGWIYLRFRAIRRTNEGDGQVAGAVAGYAVSVLATLLILPQHAEIGLGVLAILAFGDGAATLCGLWFRGPRLPWNSAKSWAGLLGFIVVGTVMSSLMFWRETHNLEAQTPGVTFTIALACGGVATLASALVESLDMRLNDNIRVGVTAAVSLTAMHAILIGL